MNHNRELDIETTTDLELIMLALDLKKRSGAESIELVRQELHMRGGMINSSLFDLKEEEFDRYDKRVLARLQALVEIARRLSRPPTRGYKITNPSTILKLVGPDMRYLPHEEMRVLVLNTKSEVTANLCLYRGTVDTTVLRVAEILRPAIVRNCPKIVLCHNHPSGDSAASPEDIHVTEQVVAAGEILDIEVLDHIIVGNPHYTSLKELLKW